MHESADDLARLQALLDAGYAGASHLRSIRRPMADARAPGRSWRWRCATWRGALLLGAAALGLPVMGLPAGQGVPDAGQVAAGNTGRWVESLAIGDGRVIVVAEGDLEPRSIGSYSVRLYGGANPDHPYDDFVGGRVLPRNGTIAEVKLAVIDGREPADLVIVMRSVGTGGYLTVHALDVSSAALRLLAACDGLPPDADVIASLATCAAPGEPYGVPSEGG